MMPDTTPGCLITLADFLAALRNSGIPIGPGELARLQHLFALCPQLQRADLYSLLTALLIKTSAQRTVFDALFADWCPDREADWPTEEPTRVAAATASTLLPAPIPDILPPPPVPPAPRHRLAWASVLGGLLLLASVVWFWPPRPIAVVVSRAPEASAMAPSPGATDATTPVPQVWVWRARVDETAIRLPWRLGALECAGLGLLALALAGGLWWRYQRRFGPLRVPERRYAGARWQPLPPPPRNDTALLSARARRQMVWQIEQFVAEEPTHRLALPQTVDATARRGGFVHLHFQPAVYERAVWCWLDRQVRHSTPRTLIQQLLATLSAAGLQARQGLFTDVPTRLDWPEQPGYHPAHEEGAGRQALVLICTDGAGLERRLAQQRWQRDTEHLLRSLQRWPRLCWVDCGVPGGRLAALLEPYGLQTIPLEQVPAWLAGVARTEPGEAAPAPALYGATRLWAAALALGGPQADLATAQTLRVALHLDVAPWQAETVLDAIQQPGERQRLLTWLLHREPPNAHGRPQGLAQQALAWWQQRYQEARQVQRVQENPLLPWEHSLAQQRWRLECALLRLCSDPDGAARDLAALADTALRDEIAQRLADYTDAASPDQGTAQIRLIWRFDACPPETQHRLRQLGWHAAPASGATGISSAAWSTFHPSPTLLLPCTLLLALALSAGAAAVQRWWMPPPPQFFCLDAPCQHPAMLAQTIQQRLPSPSGTYRVTLGSARDAQITWLPEVPAAAQLPVTWRWQPEPNPFRLPGSRSDILRAGRLAQPIRACAPHWPLRALVILALPEATTQPATRQLAMHLLDKGSADQVWLGPDWAPHLDAWLGPSPTLNRQTQLLVLVPDAPAAAEAATRLARHPGPWAVATSADLSGLRHDLNFASKRSVDTVSAHLQVLQREGSVWLSGGPEQQPGPAGLVWVQVCPGTLTMGTMNKGEDAMAYDDEILPVPRTVLLSGFQIADTETTLQQAGQTGNLPLVEVNWTQARTACQQLGGDLPTEAQWEYAARAGSRFPWSFGSDAGRLGEYAWFAGNAKTAQKVRGKAPNPLGLYDMHGNVWEWTLNWYGTYVEGVWVDPLGALDGSFRVVRGGSFNLPPADLRSANRVRGLPVDQVDFLGFRCVRVPPQP